MVQLSSETEGEILKKLAIIGASELQAPVIRKAKSMGIETHVFAWAANDVGEEIADHFYPISIVEKEAILEQCRKIGIDGICSISSDLAMVTVNYIAAALGLTGNTVEATLNSTNKHRMRECFAANGDPSPKSILVDRETNLSRLDLIFPIIVKPTDRSGSRGIFKLSSPDGLSCAVEQAIQQSFEKKALVEEYAEGQEYSVEFVSWRGEHHFLALTKKYTTGSPHFIETGHLEPACVEPEMQEKVKSVVSHALSGLGLEYGASHSEIKIDENGAIRIIEIGGRMGGDFIGSNLVEFSTGIDFVRAVVDIAMGKEPDLNPLHPAAAAAVRFIFTEEDLAVLNRLKEEKPELLADEHIKQSMTEEITDSSNRHGHYIMRAKSAEELIPYLPGVLKTNLD